MAEGMLGGVLGGEEEKPEVAAPEALASAEAFASAVAAKLAGNDPGVARKTEEFLSDQSHLLKVQAKHLEDEHALRIAHLRNQLREENVRRFGLRLRVAFQLFIALAATVSGVGIAVMLRDAFASRSVIIEPFETPSTLAASGVTGKVVASGLLDELTRLQNATHSSLQKRDLSNAWANEVTLSVPETGLSLGELSRALKARFGHDVHIDGNLTYTPTGTFALSVRGSAVPPKTFTGAATELGPLSTQAAEYIYGASEPVRYAYYLEQTWRHDEAIAFCRSAFAAADTTDRAYLLNIWSIALASRGGSLREALALNRAAIAIQPEFWPGHEFIALNLWALGDEESAWRVGENLRHTSGGRPGKATEKSYNIWDLLTWNLPSALDALIADRDAYAGVGTTSIALGPQIADVQMRLHDPAAAELAMQTTKDDRSDPTVVAIAHFVRGRAAAEAGDTARAAAEMDAFGAAVDNKPVLALQYPGYSCWIAPAEEAAGHPEKADAVLSAGGHYVDCYRFHADILDSRGDWPRAQKAYAKAVALAPDLPAAYYSWGVALAGHGDLAGADSKFKDANRRGPHWADPLKAQGDVLVKQGHTQEALVKYDEALKYAPNWKQLKEAREAIAKQKS